MRYIKYPLRETWTELLKRPTFDVSGLFGIVSRVIEQVKNNGERALR